MKEAIRSRLEHNGFTLGQLAAVGMMFSMPLSRAAFNICALLLILGWLASGSYRILLQDCRKNPALIMCITFFGCVLFSVSYSIAPTAERWSQVSTYSKLLYIPVMVGVLRDPLWIRRAWIGLFSGLTILLILFIADFWINIPGSHSLKTGTLGVFNNTIIQGLQLATLALLGLYFWVGNPNKMTLRCWLIIIITIGAIGAVLFLNPARGAQLALFLGLVAFSIYYSSGRRRWITGLSTALLFLIISLTASNVTKRFELALHEVRTSNLEKNTAVGARLNAWRISKSIWVASPWLGEGAGAYRYLAYTEYVDEIGFCPSPTCEHPHNQYLLTLVEQGPTGVIVLLAFLWHSARPSSKRTSNLRAFSTAFVTLFSVHSFFDAGLQMNGQAFVFIAVIGLALSTATSGTRALGILSTVESRSDND